MLCPLCNGEINDGAIKCKHCFSMLNQVIDTQSKTSEVVENNDKDFKIRNNLKQYNKLASSVECLECGYVGLMGVLKTKFPWYLTWWVLIPVLLTGIGIIPAIFLVIWRSASRRYTVVCPSCLNTLSTVSTD